MEKYRKNSFWAQSKKKAVSCMNTSTGSILKFVQLTISGGKVSHNGVGVDFSDCIYRDNQWRSSFEMTQPEWLNASWFPEEEWERKDGLK